jgi:hypothetical protein
MKTLAVVAVVLALWLAPQSTATATVASASAQTLGVAIADTLAAGSQGTTTLGVNATSASTSLAGKASPQSFTSLLLAQSATTRNQTVHLALASASGLANVTQATIALGGIAQVAIVAGNVTQSAGSGVTLAGASSLTLSAPTLQMTAKNARATLAIDVTYATPSGGVVLAERWTLSVS